MPASSRQAKQIVIGVYQPVPLGGVHLETLTTTINSYGHTLLAFGGFDKASLSIVDTMPILQEWYENGLGRGIIAFDDKLQRVWEGFVNSVTLQQAGLRIQRGPLLNVANRIKAVYSSIDTSTTPPTLGVRKSTAWSDNLASQARYGIWPKVVSLAGVTDSNAASLRDTHLAQYSEVETNSQFSTSGGDAISLQIECLGYFHTLTYPYNYTAAGGVTDLSIHLKRILAAAPNGWLSADMSKIANNTLQVSQWENDDKQASGLIKGLTAMGDAAANRYLFGIYEGRQAQYGAVPTDWAYEIRLNNQRQTIFNRSGGEVEPWALRPGQWLFFSDFLPGRQAQSANLRSDPRMLFIESVSYSMPYAVQVNGGKIDTLAQKLAQLGLAGASA